MKVNLLFRHLPRLAQDSGDYPTPINTRHLFAEPLPPRELAKDPSFCCEAHELLAERLRAFGGASAVGENVAAAFERRIRELDAQCPKGVAW